MAKKTAGKNDFLVKVRNDRLMKLLVDLAINDTVRDAFDADADAVMDRYKLHADCRSAVRVATTKSVTARLKENVQVATGGKNVQVASAGKNVQVATARPGKRKVAKRR